MKKEKARSVGDGRQLQWTFENKQPIENKVEEKNVRVRFKDPDPHLIYISQRRLDQYLIGNNMKEVFKLRQLLDSIDWKPFENEYKGGGRAPYHPRAVVGLVLLGIMEGKSSLRSLENLARCDIRTWWLTGGIMPDHSVIGRFLCRHTKLLTEDFFENLTRQILKNLGSDASRVAGDGTIIEAAASHYKLIKQEAAEQQAAEAKAASEVEPENEKLKEKAKRAEKAAKIAKERTDTRKAQGRKKADARINPTEPEAMNQPQKDKNVRPSYKPSVLVNEDRIITGHAVDPGNESQMIKPMVEQSERVSGQEVEELLLDAGYFTAFVLYLCYSADINLLCPKGRTNTDGSPETSKPNKQIPKSSFHYDADLDEYRCPAGQSLKPFHRYKGGKDKAGRQMLPYTQYRCEKCSGCSYKTQCSKNGKSRTLKRYDHDDLAEAQTNVMQQTQAQIIYSKRQWMVEPVFGELRYIQGLQRFRRSGLEKVRLEFSLHASAHNLRRYIRISASHGTDPYNEKAGMGRSSLTYSFIFTYLGSESGFFLYIGFTFH